MPWPIYFPIFLVLGLVIAVWGGVLVQEQVKQSEIRQLVAKSEKLTTNAGVRWSYLNGEIQSLRLMGHDTTSLSAISSLTKRLMAEAEYIEAVAYLDGNKNGTYTKIYSTGEGFGQLPEGLREVIANMASKNALTSKLSILPYKGAANMIYAAARPTSKNSLIVIESDLRELLTPASLMARSGAIRMPTLKIEFSGGEEGTLTFSGNPEQNFFDHHSELTLGGVNWDLHWDYNLGAFPKSYIWAAVFAGFVLIITSLVLWSLWSQFSLAKRVRAEVVDRTSELEQASRRFRLITDNAYDLIAIFSVSGGFEYVNSAYNRVLGYPRKNLFGQNLIDFIHTEDQPYVKEAMQAVVDGRPVSEVNFRFQTRQNSWVFMEAIAKGIFDNSWNLTGIVLHSRDVTARKKYADELARSEQRFKDFADSSADWLWETDRHYNFVYVSPGVKGTLGHMPRDMLGKPMFKVLFASKDDATRELIENLAKRHQPYREVEFWTRTHTGERVCLRLSGIPIFNESGEFSGYRGAATNITSSKVDSENMLRLATTDHLTGLLNRNRFMEELDHTITLARRHNTQGVVLFLDLDRFKAVNDTHGHGAGDAVIKGVASILQKSMRSTDVISRLAGDEFAVIMHNIDSKTAYEKVEKLIARINAMQVGYKGAKLQVTMSVGMVGYPQAGKDASQLLTSADLAMYRAKDMGRNRIYVDEEIGSSDQTSATVRVQLEWIDRLRDALSHDKFEMHFQPIVPCKKVRPVIYEALIRLRDEDGNLGAPALFIDAAEHFGMIRDLDKAVVERCIKLQSKMAEKGQTPTFSLNLSGMSFGDNELLENMKKYFKKYKADPKKFIFEVTETAAMRDIDQARSFVKALKKLGSKFALDDFGVGFSSFFYIKHLEVDYIKIDGSYIRNLDTSKEDRLFVKSLVDLATGLNIETVAEFVENKAILDELENMSVSYVQGYYLSRPEDNLSKLYKGFEGKVAQEHNTKGAKKAVKKTTQKTKAKPGKKA